MSEVIGRVSIRVWPDTRNFRKELKAKLAAMRDVDYPVDVKPRVDRRALAKDWQGVTDELSRRGVSIPAELDVDRRSLAKAMQGLDKEVRLKPALERDGLNRAVDDFERGWAKVDSSLKIKPLMSTADRDRLRDDLIASVQSGLRDGVNSDHDLFKGFNKSLRDELAGVDFSHASDRFGKSLSAAATRSFREPVRIPAKMDLQLDPHALTRLSHQMSAGTKQRLTRAMQGLALPITRATNQMGGFAAKVYQAANGTDRLKSAANGTYETLRRLSGMRLMGDTARSILEPAKNFDRIIPKLAVLSTLANQGAVALASLSSNLLTVGADLGRILAVGLAAPGVLMSMGVAAVSLILPLKKMKDELPGVGAAFSSAFAGVTEGFYSGRTEELTASMLRLAESVRGPLRSAGEAAGAWFTDLVGKFNQVVGPTIPAMFDGVVQGFANLAKGSSGLVTSLRNFGLIGAEVFPRMNAWIGEVFNNLGRWSTLNYGNMLGWIDSGWAQLKNLGNLLVNTVSLFGGLAQAAEIAGSTGLGGLTRRIGEYAEIVRSPAVQLGLANVFKAAHDSMDTFLSGLKPGLGSFLDMVSRIADDVAPRLSGALGNALGSLLQGLASPAVASGVARFADAVGSVADELSPVLRLSGETVGILEGINIALPSLARLVGGVAGGLLGMLDTLGPAIGIVVTNLSTGLGGALVSLMTPLRSLTEAVAVVAIGISESLGGALNGVAPLLGSIGTTIASALQAILPKVQSVFDSIGSLGTSLTKAFNFIAPVIVGVIDVVVSSIDVGVRMISDLFAGLTDNIGGQTLNLTILFEAMKMSFETVGLVLGTVLDFIGSSFGMMVGIVSRSVETITKLLQGDLSGALDSLMSITEVNLNGFMERTQQRGADFATNFSQSMQNAAGKGGEGFTSTLSSTIAQYRLPDQSVRIHGDTSDFSSSVNKAKAELDSLAQHSTTAVQKSLKNAVFAFESLMPSLKEYWTTIYGGGTSGAAQADANFGRIQTWVGKVKSLLDVSKIDVSKFDGDYSAALKSLYDSGGEYTTQAQALMDESVTLMQEMGLLPADIAANLETSAAGISDGAKGNLAEFSSFVSGDFKTSVQTSLQQALNPPETTSPYVENFNRLLGETAEGAGQVSYVLARMPGIPESTVGSTSTLSTVAQGAADTVAGITSQITTVPPLPAAVSTSVSGVGTAAEQSSTQIDFLTGKVASFPGLPTTSTETVSVFGGAVTAAGIIVDSLSTKIRTTPGLPETGASGYETLGSKAAIAGDMVAEMGRKVADRAWVSSLTQATVAGAAAAKSLATAGTAAATIWGAAMGAVSVRSTAASAITRASFASMAAGVAGASAAGSAAMARFAGATSAAVASAAGRIRSLPGIVRSSFGGAGGLLIGAGRSIVSGLIAGMNSMLGALRAKLHAITAMIPANKGPKAVDERLLTPAGVSIMKSLAAGFSTGVDEYVRPALSDLTREIGWGFAPQVQVPDSIGEDSGGSRIQVNVTNNNPKPETATDSTRDAMALASALF